MLWDRIPQRFSKYTQKSPYRGGTTCARLRASENGPKSVPANAFFREGRAERAARPRHRPRTNRKRAVSGAVDLVRRWPSPMRRIAVPRGRLGPRTNQQTTKGKGRCTEMRRFGRRGFGSAIALARASNRGSALASRRACRRVPASCALVTTSRLTSARRGIRALPCFVAVASARTRREKRARAFRYRRGVALPSPILTMAALTMTTACTTARGTCGSAAQDCRLWTRSFGATLGGRWTRWTTGEGLRS